ncbi:hypothetical protein [Mumia sp. DW29H23]|uniref:hypothetical protein n=1 Tax=Mumia sp. DW29H23 TaxID=3421241 RepID=UPI003D696410
MTTYVLVIAAACLALLGWAFARTDLARQLVGAVLGLALVFGVVASIFEDPVTGVRHDILVLFAMVLAVAGGGVVTTAAFETIDASRSGDTHGRTVTAAAEVLRGGAWVGGLERVAVFGALAARWPEGVAIVLAVKGLGRYPELKVQAMAGTAERFIIGTMISVIWAVACAYLAFAPYVLPPGR